MQVITIEERAFYQLIEKVVQHLREKHQVKEDRWISGEEAMKKLRITSKSTLQKLRDTGAIRFSQPKSKIILYDVTSIYAYLEQHVHETF